MIATHVAGRVPLDTCRVYRLASGVRVRERPDGDVQIGVDPARSLLLRDAPDDAAALLRESTGGTPLEAWWVRRGMDPEIWRPVFHELVSARLLVPAAAGRHLDPAPDPGLRGEHAFLADRHGPRAATRALQARADALVVVRGSGRVAIDVAARLATAGVGHVHPRPDDPVPRRVPFAPPGDAGTDPGRRLAALVRAASPTVRAHAPAAHVPPVLTVLAGDARVDPGVAAELTHSRLPHLVVRVETTRAVVGPLVLPGRTSCLLCAERHRAEADPDWPVDPDPVCTPGPAVLVAAATARATQEALEFLDGLLAPASIDGTLEWSPGAGGPRRRSWRRHPRCGCRATAPPHPPLPALPARP